MTQSKHEKIINWADPAAYWKSDIENYKKFWGNQCVLISGLIETISDYEVFGWTLLNKRDVTVWEDAGRSYQSEELILCRKSWNSSEPCLDCPPADDEYEYRTECVYGYDERLAQGWEFVGRVFNQYKVDVWRVKKGMT